MIAAFASGAAGETVECTLLADAPTGRVLIREGACDARQSPMSTFKLPLAIMGFDAGILEDDTTPLWKYRAEYGGPERVRKSVNPKIWLDESIVWYSQEITRRLGDTKFAAYVTNFDYGNKDIRDYEGKDGLTHAWLMSSLRISADEQVAFVRRFLDRSLAVTDSTYDRVAELTPVFSTSGWQVHGKTGSGVLPDGNQRLGWFVGWAEKDGRTLAFARMRVAPKAGTKPPGLAIRDNFLRELPDLVK